MLKAVFETFLGTNGKCKKNRKDLPEISDSRKFDRIGPIIKKIFDVEGETFTKSGV